jgi:GNAT superfamily N-acetyltransferase
MKKLPPHLRIEVTHVTSNCPLDYHDVRGHDLDADHPYYFGMIARDLSGCDPDRGVPPIFVGLADFGWQDGAYVCLTVGVEKKYQRQGVATAMYNIAESVAGEKLVPSSNRSPEADAFWSARIRHESQISQSAPNLEIRMADPTATALMLPAVEIPPN